MVVSSEGPPTGLLKCSSAAEVHFEESNLDGEY
jgi:hypothetical protein